MIPASLLAATLVAVLAAAPARAARRGVGAVPGAAGASAGAGEGAADPGSAVVAGAARRRGTLVPEPAGLPLTLAGLAFLVRAGRRAAWRLPALEPR